MIIGIDIVKILINGWRLVLSTRGSVRESNTLLMVVGSMIISGKDHYMPWVKRIVNLILEVPENNRKKIGILPLANQICSI